MAEKSSFKEKNRVLSFLVKSSFPQNAQKNEFHHFENEFHHFENEFHHFENEFHHFENTFKLILGRISFIYA